jgi:glycerol-3-phosphate acyltransferase PlsY
LRTECQRHGRFLLFPGDSAAELIALFATGAAAVVGHCRPIYYGFRGGRGVATALGVCFAFVPVESFASLMIAALLVTAFVPRVPYRLGR